MPLSSAQKGAIGQFTFVATALVTGNGQVVFAIVANLSPESHDRWTPYRVTPSHLGRRLLEIIDRAPLTAASQALTLPPDSIWLGRARPRIARARRDRAA